MSEKGKVDAEFESSQDEISDNNQDKNEISLLIDRVDELENTVDKITKQQAEMSHEISQYKKDIESMEEVVDEIKDEMQELKEKSDLQNSRINSINRSLDSLESDMEETKGNISETSNTLDTRLSAIEKMLDLDKRDIAEAVKPDACELEQLSTIPEASRDDEFTVRVQRAIALYENYEQISTPVRSGGKRILSKDIKTFLNGYSNTEIKYTQVQRVIDSFIEKTDDNYYIQKTDEGRAIIWKPEN